MSTGIPSRTRSLRKPGESLNNNVTANKTAAAAAASSSSRYGRPETDVAQPKTQRPSQSPTRLPTSRPRPASITGRPPSAGSSNSSMRPPPARASIRQPATESSRLSSTRLSSASSTTTSSEPQKQDRSRPPLVTSRHLRTPSASTASSTSSIARAPGHTRNKSSSTILSSSSILRPGPEPSRRPTLPDPQLKKAAFSTFQQHFSPAKNLAPKPHPSAFLAPPSPSKLPSNIAISAETARLQNELLQLHILHRQAGQVDQEWRASAKRKLGKRFGEVVKKHEAVVSKEVEAMGQANAVALASWQEGALGLDEKVQLLDEVLTGVWNLGEPGGKYARVVRRFERWLSKCQDILDEREHEDSGEDVMFLEELDAAWKDDCEVLVRKLQGWKKHLRELGTLDGASSVAIVVNGCGSLVNGMLQELSLMAQIETDALAVEADWINSANRDDDADDDTSTAGAVWRRQ